MKRIFITAMLLIVSLSLLSANEYTVSLNAGASIAIRNYSSGFPFEARLDVFFDKLSPERDYTEPLEKRLNELRALDEKLTEEIREPFDPHEVGDPALRVERDELLTDVYRKEVTDKAMLNKAYYMRPTRYGTWVDADSNLIGDPFRYQWEHDILHDLSDRVADEMVSAIDERYADLLLGDEAEAAQKRDYNDNRKALKEERKDVRKEIRELEAAINNNDTYIYGLSAAAEYILNTRLTSTVHLGKVSAGALFRIVNWDGYRMTAGADLDIYFNEDLIGVGTTLSWNNIFPFGNALAFRTGLSLDAYVPFFISDNTHGIDDTYIPVDFSVYAGIQYTF